MANRKLCKHNRSICSDCVVVTDTAKRVSEAIGLAIIANPPEITSKGWMAFALADGATDHVVYPSKAEAISHQHNEFYFAYFHLGQALGAISPKDAQIWMDVHREAHDHGLRLTDPNTNLIMPQAREQRITRRTW